MLSGPSKRKQKTFKIKNVEIQPGESRVVHLAAARLYDRTLLRIPVQVIRGRIDGPVLFISAAIHGDELNGVEIIRRLLLEPRLKRLRGTLLAVPIVNVFGFNNRSRYLPDRRDLNRSFPGSSRGSLAARLANVFLKQIVYKCTHGIDLHTGAVNRSNLPQIRACLDDPETDQLARAFGVPVILNSDLRDGSLRQSARERGIPLLLYEGGEALRFDEHAIRAGLRGCLRVMREIGMLGRGSPRKREVFIARSSSWIRAPRSGILKIDVALGSRVMQGQLLGQVSDPFGARSVEIRAPGDGIVIGAVTMPLVSQGDALLHVATFENDGQVQEQVEEHEALLLDPP